MLVRLLLWLIVLFLGYTVYQMIRQALQKPPAPPPEKTPSGEEMIQDPVCGTFVPRSDAVAAKIKGQEHYFCSSECRDTYRQKAEQ